MIRLLSSLVLFLMPAILLADTPMWVYIGTYTGKQSKGIYKCEMNSSTGQLSNLELVGETASPSFLAIHPNKQFLYAVGEISDFQKKRTGAVNAFAIDPKTGKLTLLNQQSSGGAGPCHVVVDKAGKNVLVANYGGGSCASLPIEKDGKLAEAASVIQHKGSSVNKSRQEAPHAHSINLDPANRFAFCADLGLDQVLIYKFDSETGKLGPNIPPYTKVDDGAGPRHFAFHPNGKFAYVINEIHCSVTAMSYDAEKGELKKIQTIPTLEKVARGDSTAEVVVHPTGKFLYGSNRGNNTIAIYSVNQETGELKFVNRQGKGIKTPRNFNIDPSGKFLLVGNQDGHSVIVFEIDPATGELKPTEHMIEVVSPVCIKFYLPK